jgi:hypothetical protein
VRRRTRRSTLVAVATLALTAAGQPSANAACAVLDITCQVDGTVDVVEDVVNDVPIDTPLDETIDPIIDPIVDPVLDGVFDRVDDVVGETPVDVPDPIGGGGSHVVAPPASDGPTQVKPSPVDLQGPAIFDGRNPDGPGLTRIPQAVISATSGVAPSGTEDRTVENRLGGTLGGFARGFAILLALFGLAVAFVAVQDRLDRHDPRLALAPVGSDVVEFA